MAKAIAFCRRSTEMWERGHRSHTAMLSFLERLSKLLKMTPGIRERIGGKSFVDHIQELE